MKIKIICKLYESELVDSEYSNIYKQKDIAPTGQNLFFYLFTNNVSVVIHKCCNGIGLVTINICKK